MKQIFLGPTILAVALVAIGPARADDRTKSETVDRVLAEWQRSASAINSVEVKFRLITDEPSGEHRKVEEGRAVLAASNRALFEVGPVGPGGKATSIERRLIWDGRSILFFEMDGRKVSRFPLETEKTAAPRLIRLPFFYQMSVEEAKRDYEWAVIKDDGDRLLLKVVPRGKLAESLGFRVGVLQLDRKSLLPQRMMTWDVDGLHRQDYRVIDVQINQVESTDDLINPCLDAWTVSEAGGWWTRLFLR